MVKVVPIKTNDYSAAKIMKFLTKFSLPLVKDENEEYFSFHWSSWKARGHIIFFFGILLTLFVLQIYLEKVIQINQMDLLGKTEKNVEK